MSNVAAESCQELVPVPSSNRAEQGGQERLRFSPEVVELLRFAHEHIRHEDSLVNHRLTWFLTLQGLTFAGLGFLVRDPSLSLAILMIVLCLVGLGTPISAGYALGGQPPCPRSAC